MPQIETVAHKFAAVPTTAGVAARLAVAELKRRGLDPTPLLARCRLSASDNDQGGRRIDVKSQIEFLNLASQAAGDEHLGLTLAEQVDLREMGMLYYVAASSHRLGDALNRLERYVRLANEALMIRIGRGPACRIVLSYAGVPRHLDRHQIECFILIVLRLCRQLVGHRITPLAAGFVHHRSGGVQRVRKLLGCDVQFDAEADHITLDTTVLDLPVVGDDPFLHAFMLKSCEDAIRLRTFNVSAFRTVVENTIAPLLPHAEAQAKTVAEKLGMSERTFARRLASEGVTFSAVLDGLRCDLAVRHLEDPDLQISQIAWLLGFNQPSAFSHACRRWTGKTPLEYRRGRLLDRAIY